MGSARSPSGPSDAGDDRRHLILIGGLGDGLLLAP